MPKRVVAVLCSALLAGMVANPILAEAADSSCAMTVEYFEGRTGDEPVSIDREGNTLWRVSGDGALSIRTPEGSIQYVSSRTWMADAGRMLPSGNVVGAAYDLSDTQEGKKAFVWVDGRMRMLSRQGFEEAYVESSDVNGSGVIVGSASGVGGIYWPSVKSTPRLLPTRDGKIHFYSATSIDRDGTIYGRGRIAPDGPTIWLMWTDNTVKPFTMPDRFTAREVSNGMAVGYVATRDGTRRPALYGPKGLWIPPLPDGATGQGWSLTPKGEWGGYIQDTTGRTYPFVSTYKGPMRYLPINGGIVDLVSSDSVTALAWVDLGAEGEKEAIVRCIQP